jgi:Ca2+-binding RTX toxin-like protein
VSFSGETTAVSRLARPVKLQGSNFAFTSLGWHQSLANDGDIITDNRAVFAEHRIAVTNSGTIQTGSGIRCEEGGDITNLANGQIIVQDSAVSIYSGAGVASTLTNYGTIDASYYVIDSGFGDETVVNRGIMKGTISLGAGNDTFDNRRGSVDADISNDEGNDTLITDDAAVKFGGAFGETGTDTVKSTVSYLIGDGVENLQLIGKADVDATGNGLKNRLDGNSGANHLTGNGGRDRLDGHAGNDLMTGGTGNDTFVFTTGAGRDRITDFQPGHDHIDLRGWDAVTSFADLKAHHVTDTGSDLVIQAGPDRLTLTATDLADLHAVDFLF